MDVATALAVAQTLFAALQCAEVRNLCSSCKYESELQKLLETVKTIKNFLVDVDSNRQELKNEGKNWVENLKNAVYDADDLMDEFNTIAQRLERIPGGMISKKVRRFFSSHNQWLFSAKISSEIKKLREKLDCAAKNHNDFGFSKLYKPAKSREETCSYVFENDIIGRDADKEIIVDLLLQDDLEKNISFVSIVGIGGLGKTTLAQLVYNDCRIKEAFEGNMYWVCVSENFGVKNILGKMISREGLEFEDLYLEFRNKIEGERYLLVLDDVWSENSMKWAELKNFLILGGRGSRILVTSRSKKVAGCIGNYPIHALPGLAKENSWELFKKISLGERKDKADTSLVEIGKEIVEKCANVPLSIRVVASLLCDQDIETWQSLKNIDLAILCEDDDDIMPTLMFSYYHLSPELKSCFSFCSLFPEDYVFRKEELIHLWMAQGYLVPSSKKESMEDVGEKYLSILLHRCFFQQSTENDFDEEHSIKMHDLIHDLARKVANECAKFSDCRNDLEGKVRHLMIDSNEGLVTWFRSSNYPGRSLRTSLSYCNLTDSDVDAIISNCNYLRVFVLSYSITKKLPDRFGKLLHLRYLDLSNNDELEMLPNSITKLYNLQTLKLVSCSRLKALPKETRKLVNLRVLDIDGSNSLTHMPPGIDKLTCLHTLTRFILRRDDDLKQHKKGKLVDLVALFNNLRGYINVFDDEIESNMSETDYMCANLDFLKLNCNLISYHKESHESLLKNMFFSHQFLQKIRMEHYGGTILPSWGPGLVRITLVKCRELQCLPSSLSQLRHLKHLILGNLRNVEYIEIDAPSPSAIFFPSLENLELGYMQKLKGFWMEEAVFIPSFPQLHVLSIRECKGLRYFPPCPRVKELDVSNVSEELAFRIGGGSIPISLKRFSINNSSVFNSLFREFVGSVNSIILGNIENLGTIREGFQRFAITVRELVIKKCRGLENLGIAWKSLHSLTYLEICDCKDVLLPKGIKYLSSLQSLKLSRCEFKLLPEEMCHLSSLNTLKLLWSSPELIDRCQESDGEDWPKISHIQNLTIF